MTWSDEIRAIHQEAGGLLDLHVVQQQDAGQVLIDGLAGGTEAARLVPAISYALASINAAPRRTPAFCATCPRPIRRSSEFSLVIALRDRPDATRGLALAICKRCATEPAAIRTKAVLALRRIWPDGCEVVIDSSHGEGHA